MPHLIDSVEQALQNALWLQPEDILVLPGDSHGRPERRRAVRTLRSSMGMHVNPVPEVCLCLSGEAFLHLDDARYRLHRPRTCVIPSGIRHGEGYCRPDRSYSLLWLVLSEPALGGVVVTYRRPERWTVQGRFHLHAAGAADLVGLVKTGQVREQAVLWRASLLSVLGEAHRLLVARRNESVPPAIAFHQGLLEQVRAILDSSDSQDVTVRQLAQLTRLSERYLNRLFRQWAGQPIHQYLMERRMRQAMEMCRRGELMVKEIALALGYHDPLYFSRAFHRYFGFSPTQAREQPNP